MDKLRTPDDHFENLPGYDFTPHYIEVDDFEGGSLRVHYIDEGPQDAPVVLMLHGEPSWSYLYRKMIPIIAAAGYRTVVPDLVGFGRSDKPAQTDDYSYQRHVDWMRATIEAIDLQAITLFCQDWGGLIGLRIAAENSDQFAGIIAANTGLPTGDETPRKEFMTWQRASRMMNPFDVGRVVQGGTTTELPPDVVAAYDAPFPDESYKAGARIFPSLVPTRPDDPSNGPNTAAWEKLRAWDKPFLTAFSDNDPITRGVDKLFQRFIPGSKGQLHTTIENGGHFLQEDQGHILGQIVVDFMTQTGT